MNCTTRITTGGSPLVDHYTYDIPIYIHTYLYMYVQDQNIESNTAFKNYFCRKKGLNNLQDAPKSLFDKQSIKLSMVFTWCSTIQR